MPVYDYECSRCACRFEARRSISDNDGVKCPTCGEDAQRLFMPVPIIFKGSGFYVTDNRPTVKAEVDRQQATHSFSTPSTPAPASKPSDSRSTAKS